MKNLFTVATLTVLMFTTEAQQFPELDASPMDAAYYPPRAAFRTFAKTEEAKTADEPVIRVIYSRPQKKGREIFGELVKYGEVWRVGANEATEVLFFKNVTIGSTKLDIGRYTIYAVPQENEWEVHFSSDLDLWGHYAFKPEESTLAKITVPSQKTEEIVEAFTILFEESAEGTHMIMAWDDRMVRVPILI
ncbi:MAG: DUF2911 domain-containing protein [Bacteroidota bacterium]